MLKASAFLFTLLISLFAFGGEYSIYQRIHFQKESTWVPADKTCILGQNIYHQKAKFILVTSCEDGVNCNAVAPLIVQPIASIREFCVDQGEKRCNQWKTVDFIQGPVVKVEVYENPTDYTQGYFPKKVLNYRIPHCLEP